MGEPAGTIDQLTVTGFNTPTYQREMLELN